MVSTYPTLMIFRPLLLLQIRVNLESNGNKRVILHSLSGTI